MITFTIGSDVYHVVKDSEGLNIYDDDSGAVGEITDFTIDYGDDLSSVNNIKLTDDSIVRGVNVTLDHFDFSNDQYSTYDGDYSLTVEFNELSINPHPTNSNVFKFVFDYNYDFTSSPTNTSLIKFSIDGTSYHLVRSGLSLYVYNDDDGSVGTPATLGVSLGQLLLNNTDEVQILDTSLTSSSVVTVSEINLSDEVVIDPSGELTVNGFVPDAPDNLTLTNDVPSFGGTWDAVLSWDAPENTGGVDQSELTYTVNVYTESNDTRVFHSRITDISDTTVTVEGLSSVTGWDSGFYFEVTSSNVANTSSATENNVSLGYLATVFHDYDTETAIIYGSDSATEYFTPNTDYTLDFDTSFTIYAEGGVDYILTDGGDDTIYGGSGDDDIYTSSGSDLVYGESGDDVLELGSGDDTAYGGIGDDTVEGDGGSDTLYGGDGDDTVIGGWGSDTIYGGIGDDTLTGEVTTSTANNSADTFIWDVEDGSVDLGDDTITDFKTSSGDVIDLSRVIGLHHDISSVINVVNADGQVKLNIVAGGLGTDLSSSDISITLSNIQYSSISSHSYDGSAGPDAWLHRMIDEDHISLGDYYISAPSSVVTTPSSGVSINQEFNIASDSDSFDDLTLDIISIPSGVHIYKSDGTEVTDSTTGLTGEDLEGLTYTVDSGASLSGTFTYSLSDGTTSSNNSINFLDDTLPSINQSSSITVDSQNGITNNIDLDIDISDYTDLEVLTIDLTSIPSGIHIYKSDGTEVTTSTDGLTGEDLEGLTYTVDSGASLSGSLGYSLSNGVSTSAHSITFDNNITIDPPAKVTLSNSPPNFNSTFSATIALTPPSIGTGLNTSNISYTIKVYQGVKDTSYSFSGYSLNTNVDYSKGTLVQTISNVTGTSATVNNLYSRTDSSYYFEVTSHYGSAQSTTTTDTLVKFSDDNVSFFNSTGGGFIGEELEAGGDDIVLYTGDNADYLSFSENIDYTIYSQGGNDYITTSSGDDIIYGGDGNDTITSGSGDDYIKGGSGNDTINAGAGDDTIYGNSGDDTINGEDGDDTIYGGNNNDTINAGFGDDTVYGGSGNDNINGYDGDDLLYGGSGNDTITGSRGDDTIYGGSGNDNLRGWSDDDIIYGGSGNDSLRGDTGSDTFKWIIENDSVALGHDTIVDFNTSEGDTIDLSGILRDHTDITSLVDVVNDGGKVKLEITAGGGNTGASQEDISVKLNNITFDDQTNYDTWLQQMVTNNNIIVD